MRLIDADALPIVSRGKKHHRKYVFADITDAPTVDAVPVEWLEWRIEHAEREGFVEVARMLQTVHNWWNDQQDLWKDEKEQEAR